MRNKKTKLVPRERAFVDAFVRHHLISQAAIDAGYAPSGAKTIGYRLMRNAIVKAEIDRKEKEVAERNMVDAAWVLRQAVEVHRKCMGTDVDSKFDPIGAIRALELIGKHRGVRAFVEDAAAGGAIQPVSLLLQQFIFNTVRAGAQQDPITLPADDG